MRPPGLCPPIQVPGGRLEHCFELRYKSYVAQLHCNAMQMYKCKNTLQEFARFHSNKLFHYNYTLYSALLQDTEMKGTEHIISALYSRQISHCLVCNSQNYTLDIFCALTIVFLEHCHLLLAAILSTCFFREGKKLQK